MTLQRWWWVTVYTHTHITTDRTINLLISSNVHYVHLGGDNKAGRNDHQSGQSSETELSCNKIELLKRCNKIEIRRNKELLSRSVIPRTSWYLPTEFGKKLSCWFMYWNQWFNRDRLKNILGPQFCTQLQTLLPTPRCWLLHQAMTRQVKRQLWRLEPCVAWKA